MAGVMPGEYDHASPLVQKRTGAGWPPLQANCSAVPGLAHLLERVARTMRFCGKLMHRGQVVLDPATGDLWETTAPSGVKEWGGHFDPMIAFVAGSDVNSC